ncbi:MAG: patatin-like phospholipase family protein [Chitinophagaceae bacterium]
MKTIIGVAILLLVCCAAPAQEQPIRNLVFEGAGIRGIAYCGAIEALEKQHLVPAIEKVGGTSAGSIVALCVALGYTAQEISDLLYNTNFKKFNDGRFFFPGGINRMGKYFGWYRGQRFTRWLEAIIARKTGDPDISFEALYARGFKDLYATATLLNEQRLVVLSRHSYPKMRVKDAVRISCSIPLYFEALFVDREGRIYRSPRNRQGLDVMIDGGSIANFPIRIFDSVETKAGAPSVIANGGTLGFRIDRDEQIVYDKAGRGLAGMPVTSFKEYMAALYNITLESVNRQLLYPADWKRTVSISDGGLRPRIRKLSKTEITVLISNGRTATEQYLQTQTR